VGIASALLEILVLYLDILYTEFIRTIDFITLR